MKFNEWPECPDARISQSGGPSEGKEAVEISWTFVKKQAAQQQQALRRNGCRHGELSQQDVSFDEEATGSILCLPDDVMRRIALISMHQNGGVTRDWCKLASTLTTLENAFARLPAYLEHA